MAFAFINGSNSQLHSASLFCIFDCFRDDFLENEDQLGIIASTSFWFFWGLPSSTS